VLTPQVEIVVDLVVQAVRTTWPLLVPLVALAVVLGCLAFQKANFEAM